MASTTTCVSYALRGHLDVNDESITKVLSHENKLHRRFRTRSIFALCARCWPQNRHSRACRRRTVSILILSAKKQRKCESDGGLTARVVDQVHGIQVCRIRGVSRCFWNEKVCRGKDDSSSGGSFARLSPILSWTIIKKDDEHTHTQDQLY